MTGPLAQAWQIASDWLLAVVGLVGSATLGLAGIVYRNRERSQTNKRILLEPENSNTKSVADLASENNQKLDRLKDQQDDVVRRLDSIAEAVEDDGDTLWRGGETDTDD